MQYIEKLSLSWSNEFRLYYFWTIFYVLAFSNECIIHWYRKSGIWHLASVVDISDQVFTPTLLWIWHRHTGLWLWYWEPTWIISKRTCKYINVQHDFTYFIIPWKNRVTSKSPDKNQFGWASRIHLLTLCQKETFINFISLTCMLAGNIYLPESSSW